jgi:hypothetical protein
MGLDRVERSVATRMTTPPAASEQNRAVSFDIFLQRFRDGDASSGGREEALRVLRPLLAGPPDGGFGLVRTDDGDAEVYGLNTDSLMFTHASGRLIWPVMVDVAQAADYVIMPVGCPVCVTAADHVDELPEALRDTAVVVDTGDDVIRVVTT